MSDNEQERLNETLAEKQAYIDLLTKRGRIYGIASLIADNANSVRLKSRVTSDNADAIIQKLLEIKQLMGLE